jgi:hypothetical protein
MAKDLIFTLSGADYSAAPVKIDRKKLYGWSEVKALDDAGNECVAVNMDESGTLILPKGGLGMGILSPEGEWVERASLKALTPDGLDAPLVPSSYDAPVLLGREASVEEFLDHNITALYQLSGASGEFIRALGDKIFTFTYNLRADYEGSPAFVLAKDGAAYLFTGQNTNFAFLSLNETAVLDEDEEESADEAEIDFTLM